MDPIGDTADYRCISDVHNDQGFDSKKRIYRGEQTRGE